MGIELARAFVRVRGDTSLVARDINRGKGRILGAVSGLAAGMGRIMAGFGVIGGIGVFAGIIRSGEMFNRAMRNSLAIIEDVSDALRKDMKKAAFEAAAATQFSATQAAEAFFFLASAGLDARQSIAALPAVAEFAQAGMFDLAEATSLAANAQSILGLKSKDAVQNLANLVSVTDVLVKANTLADATVREFAQALTTKSGAAARAVGKDMEELTAVLAVLAEQGAKGARGGTAFNIILRDLTTRALENKAAFEAVGISVFDASENVRNMADIIEDMEKSLGNMTPELQKATLLQLGFADESSIFIQTLLGSSEAIRGFEKELRNAAGTTKEVASKQLTPFQKGWARLTAAIAEASSNLMEWAGPILGRAFTNIASWFKFFRAGFIVLGQLIKSVGQIFMDVWEIAIGFVKDLFGPLLKTSGNVLGEIVGNTVKNLDVMLGSWEGLRLGVIEIFSQIGFAWAALWTGMKADFFQAMIHINVAFTDFLSTLGEIGLDTFGRLFGEIAVGAEKLKAKLQGKEWLLTPKEEEEIIERTIRERREKIQERREWERLEASAQLRKLEKLRERELARIGQRSLDQAEEWKKRLKELPKLSDRFRAALAKIAGAAKGPAKPGLPGLDAPEVPGAARPAGLGPGGAARAGFREFGRQIQDALMKNQLEEKKVALMERNKVQNDLMIAAIKEINPGLA